MPQYRTSRLENHKIEVIPSKRKTIPEYGSSTVIIPKRSLIWQKIE